MSAYNANSQWTLLERAKRSADGKTILPILDVMDKRGVGDLIADQFISGRVERVSREAPVLILQYDNTTIVPGGAGNAAANVAALGARVDVVGLVGRDDEGRRLLKALPSRANTRASPCWTTPTASASSAARGAAPSITSASTTRSTSSAAACRNRSRAPVALSPPPVT